MKLLQNIKKFIPLLPKPKKRFWDFIIDHKYIVVAALLLMIVVLYNPGSANKLDDNKLPIQIKGATVRVAVADSPTEMSRGLMHRKELPENEGMLFVYNYEGKHSFWMKNTLIPLDMVWINSNKEVVHIEHSAPPCKKSPCPHFRPSYPALYVLELNGGWSIDHDLVLGDQVSFSLK